MPCTKPNCDCVEQAEKANGGNPVKQSKCLYGDNSDLEQEKTQTSNRISNSKTFLSILRKLRTESNRGNFNNSPGDDRTRTQIEMDDNFQKLEDMLNIKEPEDNRLREAKRLLTEFVNLPSLDIGHQDLKCEAIDLIQQIEGKSNRELLTKLEGLLTNKYWKISFNFDEHDGYFCEVYKSYSIAKNFPHVADLKTSTKRKTLKEAIIAAIEYLENPDRHISDGRFM